MYTVTSVTPVAGDPTAFVVTLNKPLGGGNPTTGVAPTANENGDRITLSVPGGGAGGGNFSLRMNVLQGDTDHTGETGGTHSVLAADFSAVKKKFFKDTTDTTTGDASYSAFHDVNGNGNILANDFSEVKKRFFQNLAPLDRGAGGGRGRHSARPASPRRCSSSRCRAGGGERRRRSDRLLASKTVPAPVGGGPSRPRRGCRAFFQFFDCAPLSNTT